MDKATEANTKEKKINKIRKKKLKISKLGISFPKIPSNGSFNSKSIVRYYYCNPKT
jgi:hypothetical protein